MSIENENQALPNDTTQDVDNEATSPSFVEILKQKADETANDDTTADNTLDATADSKTATTDNAQGKTPDVPQTADNETQAPAGQADNTVPTEKISSPHAWNADLKQVWDKIPIEAQKAISEREKQMVDKLNSTSEEVGFAREIKQTLQPYDDVIHGLNSTPKEVVSTLLPVAKVLYTGSTLDKLQLINQIAQQHNIPLQMLFQQDNQEALNQLQMQHLQHQNNLMQQSNQQIKQQQQGYQQELNKNQLLSVIDQFRADKPDFDTLRGDMSKLVIGITAENPNIGELEALQQAYEQAKWLNPQARQQQIDKEYEQKEKQRIEAVKQKTADKKNATLSLKNSGGQNAPSNIKGKSFEDIMREKAQAYNKRI